MSAPSATVRVSLPLAFTAAAGGTTQSGAHRMASKRRLETVRPWQANEASIAARATDENYRVYKYEDGTQLAGLFRKFSDGKLHMDAGSRRTPSGNTAELQYWQESRSRYVGAGGVQLNAKICSDIALQRVAAGQAAVIIGGLATQIDAERLVVPAERPWLHVTELVVELGKERILGAR